MRRFEYIRPTTLQETTNFLYEHAEDALVMAGGTAVVVLMSQGVIRPRYVVDLGRLPALRGLQLLDNGGVRIDALTSIRTLERDSFLTGRYSMLAEAASQVASVRVRNMATVGGSICYGEPQTDLPPALIAMGATVSIAGTQGTRTMELEKFFLGPYETALETGEVLTEVFVPSLQEGAAGCHLKFTIGSPGNKPVANASILIRLDPATHRCAEARIVMGAVGPVPTLATEAASLLKGEHPDDRLITEAARRASEQADPVDDLRGAVWYKRRIIKVLIERGLKCALRKAAASSERP